ncbi:hypothetical protein EJ03DRAFT_339686 [Teratosphaeria nubilosa]|uniref:Uncharacterized protein n=1 Tax=Teratosphaeria nubilosa TaxID=161662 RepID=A0A6G1KWD0_9PEZI|nr:hypothetical protein EJ03DRAFT_339686 [Teratosphaeria nubilosa]
MDAKDNSDDSGNGVDVYLRSTDGSMEHVIANIDLDLIQKFSSMQPVVPRDPRLPGKLTVITRKYADPYMARRIASWIQLCDAEGYRPLTPDFLGIETFDKLLEAYVTCWALRIRIGLRGDEIIEAIEQYIRQGPLSFDEFAMIMEYLQFDGKRQDMAKKAVMQTEDEHGMPFIVPQLAEIEAWAKDQGYWEDMIRLRGGKKRVRKVSPILSINSDSTGTSDQASTGGT